jgi:hypothetical protein
MTIAEPIRRILLSLRPAGCPNGGKPKSFRDSLSTIEFADDGETLFLGGDETVESTPSIERLRREDARRYDRHDSQSVAAFIGLPDEEEDDEGRVGEIDIEGLARDGDALWAVGSHSAKRSNWKPEARDTKNIERLGKVTREENRFFLARIPLRTDRAGFAELPHDRTGRPRAARLPGLGEPGSLIDALEEDLHLGPFLQAWKSGSEGDGAKVPAIPGKDNGFDVEGLAVRSGRIFLGLRGPVLRGWTMILEIAVEEPDPDSPSLVLATVGGTPYLKHFLDLGGLGVRDLCADRDDLLILAGPTMDLDGPTGVYRWHGALARVAEADTITSQGSGRLSKAINLPFGEGCDHPEGMALLPNAVDGVREIAIVYDSPDAKSRCVGVSAVYADVFVLT